MKNLMIESSDFTSEICTLEKRKGSDGYLHSRSVFISQII